MKIKRCDVCNRSMTYLGLDMKPIHTIGALFSLKGKISLDDEYAKGFKSIYPEITKDEYSVCHVCLLKSVGLLKE